MPRRLAAFVTLPVLLLACTQFPELDARVSDDVARAGYPQIAPLAPILAQADALSASGADTPQTAAPIQSRIAALNARAARLRGPVIPPAARARMLRGVTGG